MTGLPLFPVTSVGAGRRPADVRDAQRRFAPWQLSRRGFDRVADRAVADFLRLQEEIGCDIVTDGELRRDNFYSFVADKLDGVKLMTLAEMLDIVEDKAGFERLLQTLDVPGLLDQQSHLRGPIARREPLAVDDFRFAKRTRIGPSRSRFRGPTFSPGRCTSRR